MASGGVQWQRYFAVVRRRIERVQPRAHRSRELGLRIPARHLVAVARGPHDIGIGRIRQREAGFAAAHGRDPNLASAARAETAEAPTLHVLGPRMVLSSCMLL